MVFVETRIASPFASTPDSGCRASGDAVRQAWFARPPTRALARSSRGGTPGVRATRLGGPSGSWRPWPARSEPILVGPWLGEVGFELLYWIPFLRWFARDASACRASG